MLIHTHMHVVLTYSHFLMCIIMPPPKCNIFETKLV